MKHTKNMQYIESVEARELFLYATNSGVLYARQIVPVISNLNRKYKKGTFDAIKAIDAFYYVADSASRMYEKEFGYKFTVTERYTAASDMVEFFTDEIMESA